MCLFVMRPSVLSISTGCCQAWVKVADDFLDFMKESETKAQCWRILFRQPFGCFYSHIAHFGSAIWALSMRFLDAGDDCAGSFVYEQQPPVCEAMGRACHRPGGVSQCTAMRLPTRFGCVARLASSAACARFGQRAAMWRVGVCRVHRLLQHSSFQRFCCTFPSSRILTTWSASKASIV